jgi:cysteine desulfurase/selenocysteine lyase
MSPIKHFDAELIRADFPILHQQIHGQPLVYLDNAATTQKPQSVIDALVHYYSFDNANVHRGAHTLADRATASFEGARVKIQQFINAPHSHEVIWTRGTTESINLVAHSFLPRIAGKGDVVLVSAMEHHSNIVPWQLVAATLGAQVLPIPVTDAGDIDLIAYDKLFEQHQVKMVSVTWVSNALGTVNPIEAMTVTAHKAGAYVMIDAAQAVGHWTPDVQALDADFVAFSGHKMFAPTGVGVLWGREALLNAMPPFLGGGEMIETVSFAGTTFNQLPFKFEAGTPNIADVIGLGAAVDYLNQFDRQAMRDHEDGLLAAAHDWAKQQSGLRIIGEAGAKSGVLSFVLDGAHASDVGMLLDQQGVAVRTGNHCAQPIMAQFGVTGTVRASFSFYNTLDDVARLAAAVDKARTFL